MTSDSILSGQKSVTDAQELPIGVDLIPTISIARSPKKETWSNFFKVAAENFRMTNGILFCMLSVFTITFVVFPGWAFDT